MKPLPIYPAATGDRVAVLKAAKARLDTDTKVVPQDAVPGSPGPILAMGEHPDHLTEYVYVKPDGVQDPQRVGAALQFWLDGGKTHTEADLLSQWMGVPVTFVGTEDREGGVRFS